jgi:hypothetical protein
MYIITKNKNKLSTFHSFRIVHIYSLNIFCFKKIIKYYYYYLILKQYVNLLEERNVKESTFSFELVDYYNFSLLYIYAIVESKRSLFTIMENWKTKCNYNSLIPYNYTDEMINRGIWPRQVVLYNSSA